MAGFGALTFSGCGEGALAGGGTSGVTLGGAGGAGFGAFAMGATGGAGGAGFGACSLAAGTAGIGDNGTDKGEALCAAAAARGFKLAVILEMVQRSLGSRSSACRAMS